MDASMDSMNKFKKLVNKLNNQIAIRTTVLRTSAVESNAKKFDYYSKEKTRNNTDYERKLRELKDEYTRYDEYCERGMNPDTSTEEAKDKVLIKYKEELKVVEKAYDAAVKRCDEEQEKDRQRREWEKRQRLNEIEADEQEEKLQIILKAKLEQSIREAEKQRKSSEREKLEDLQEKAKEYNKQQAEFKAHKSDEFRSKYSPYSYVNKVKVCKEEEGKLTEREWYFYTKLLKHQRNNILELSDLNEVRDFLQEAKGYIIMTEQFESNSANLTDEEWDIYYNIYTTPYHKEKIISIQDKVKRNKFILSLKKDFKKRGEEES